MEAFIGLAQFCPAAATKWPKAAPAACAAETACFFEGFKTGFLNTDADAHLR
jgi:hypothetical protein